MIPKRKLIICRSMALIMVLSSINPLVCAQESTDKQSGYKSNNLKIESREDLKGKDTVLNFDLLRDSGYALRQLRELSIHIFDECTRKEVTITDCRNFTGSHGISENDIDKNAKYLSPRSAWIFFYIATFEPILQLFRNDTLTTEEQSGKMIVPADIAPKMDKFWQRLDASIGRVDKQVDILSKLLNDDPDNSVEMANAALKIYKETRFMEKLRQEIYLMLQKSKLKGVKKTVAI